MTQRDITIGFLPLTDAAPIIIAQEKGFFSSFGLNATLALVSSWSQIRDKLASGDIDAAHMLAPMAPASWLPNAYSRERFVTALSFNLNGNAITVSENLYQEMVEADPDAMFERPTSARALRHVIANRLTNDRPSLSIGTVFPYSSHNYALRYWLGAEGINPDRDVHLVTAPPSFMVDQLEKGHVDLFCVGEPWNTHAEFRESGRAIVKSADIWQNMPEKILGVRESWVNENPGTHHLLVMALLKSLEWLGDHRNRDETAYILSDPKYLNISTARLGPALMGRGVLPRRRSIVEMNDYLLFNQYTSSFPWRSHALWFLTQMVRWGQVTEAIDFSAIVAGCYLPEIYRRAAAELGVPSPTIDMKIEGRNEYPYLLEQATGPIVMSASRFIDGEVFDPEQVRSYIERFLRHNMRISVSDIHTDEAMISTRSN